jgi:uroporphyrinogen-III decarboxylase
MNERGDQQLNSRERVNRTFRFQETDRPACDLMQGVVWVELQDYFKLKYGIAANEDVIRKLDPDFVWTLMNRDWRWTLSTNISVPGRQVTEIKMGASVGPLAGVTHDQIMKLKFLNLDYYLPDDYPAYRANYPDKAIVFWPGWLPLFWSACEAFGSEEAMVLMMCEPDIFEAFIRILHETTMEIILKGLPEAAGYCDCCLLGDDFATQNAMMIAPEYWRKYIKPYLAEQVRVIRDSGMYVMYHSCGSVRPVLPDLIDIGINALSVFQTTAAGMDAESIARDFGGRLAFYGGIDVQKLLSHGSRQDVRAAVRNNVRIFEPCGGYFVANSHFIPDIKIENLETMFKTAKTCYFT